MRKDFYIFRHGETDYNLEKRWQGCGLDIELNATGIAQANALASALQSKNLQIIYSSYLKRAVQTSEIVAQHLQLKVNIVPNLREACLGQCEGLRKEEVAAKFADIYRLWCSPHQNYWDVSFPDGESKRQIQQRMLKVFEELLSTPETIIGITSHGCAIRYLLLGFGKVLDKVPNTAIFHIIYEHGQWLVTQD